MTEVPFPLLSAPGRNPQAAGGRLVNCYPEQLADTAGKKFAYWRSPGLAAFAQATAGAPRGSLAVGNAVYHVVGTKVYSVGAGGAVTALSGAVAGTKPVFIAANNAAVPQVVIVAPGDGAYLISGGAVVAYPDPDVGQPNSVVFHRGYFVFTYGNGGSLTSGINNTNIATTDYASAESKPDTLYRPYPLGNGQILLCGSSSIEVWGGQNDTAYPFNYVSTIPRGIIGPYAIGGNEDGFGKGVFFVGDDYGVHTLNGYSTVKISSPDVDKAIEGTADKTTIQITCFIGNGHSFVVVRSATWCWVYDVGMQSWHERESYLKTYWRGAFALKAFDKWLCSDVDTGALVQIAGSYQDELGAPLRMKIETGPFGAFPKPIRINEIELYLTKGVGIATGRDPDQTNPLVEISVSPNGGMRWVGPRMIPVGRQAETGSPVRGSIWGHADRQGVRWRFEFASAVPFGFMGADMKADVLG